MLLPKEHLFDAAAQLHVPCRPNPALLKCCKVPGVKVSDKADHGDKTGLRGSSVRACSVNAKAGSLQEGEDGC